MKEAVVTLRNGLVAYPITPANEHGHVDIKQLQHLVKRLCNAQVDAIGLLGSTGTYMYLCHEERCRALSAAVDVVDKQIPIVVGVGALRTDDSIKLAQAAKSGGATAGLLAAVSYTPLNEDEVFAHFESVAKSSGLPLIIYDNPGTTHFKFSPTLIARLSKVEGVIGIKNPTNSKDEIPPHLEEQRKLLPSGFSIGYSGDWNAATAMISGADSWHSVLGGLLPEFCLKIVKAAKEGNKSEAERLDHSVTPIWDLFREYSSLRVVYALAEHLGICAAKPPLPIMPLTNAAKDKIASIIQNLPSDVLN